MQTKTRLPALLKRLWPLGVRMQLTAWYAAIFAVLMLLFGMVYYFHLQSVLFLNLDTNLQLRAQQVAGATSLQDGGLVIDDSTASLAGLIDRDGTPKQSSAHPASDDKNPNLDVDFDALIQVRNSNGQVEYSTAAFDSLIVPPQNIQKALHGNAWTDTVVTAESQEIRLRYQPLVRDDNIAGVVLVGTSLSPLESTLHHVVIELFLVAPFILILGALGSYWLATRAFRPITRLTSIARKIQGGHLHSRVPVPHTNDEVQHLALTFNEMLDHLEMTFKQQRRFIADASHELRTPVAAIRSMTDVALDQPMPASDYVSVLRDVNIQAEHLGNLIADLLTLARADEGHIRFEREPLRLDCLAHDVVATMESLATEKGITLNIEAHQPALVMGDEARMMQVLINLLDNALKYTSQGGAVTVHVQPTETQVLLTVQDTGVGIAQEHITHIFERFYRVDSARTRSAGGTGLGLAIVKWIVTIHHGTITVTSQPGKGSTFRIALPKLQETPNVISSRSHKLIVNSTLESPYYVNAIEAKED